MKLYEINATLKECVDVETREIIDLKRLSMLMMERNEKLENVALWIKNLESDVTEMKAERENLAQREKVALKKAESLKRWLTASLEGTRFSTPRVAVSCRNSKSVDVDENIVDHKWFKEKITYTLDKQAIKSAIESGEKIKGCTIIEKLNIQIQIRIQ